MCGIAGVLFADPARPSAPAVLKAMGDAIAHRGPDAEGFWSEPGVGLVHRRLSIIDLAGGDQPIGNEDGSVQVIFNGEIYNFQELRRGLEAKGHRFRTKSDTEVLVHLYEEHGEDLVERLRGMFAFALWDRRQRRLLLARDRLGIKPLYVYRDAEKLLFASEPKAILVYPGVQAAVDPAALEDYLAFGMVPGRRSIFRGVEKLPPGHTLVATHERLTADPRRYWQLHLEADESRTEEQWEEEIRAKLDEAVRLHLIADVPVGAFLSGGIDSSIIVASAAGRTEGALQTFSIGFREEEFSELVYAREVAQKYGTRHVEEVITPDAVSLIDELTYYFDEPFADASAVPTYLVARLARGNVKVVLSGDGGDEAFGGYSRYAHDLKEAGIRRWLPGWFRRAVLGPLASAWPKADWMPRSLRAKTALTNLSLDPAAAYANTLSLCRPRLRRHLLGSDVISDLDGHRPEDLIEREYQAAPAHDALAGMIAADVAVVLPDDFLVKVDRATMAHGLEARPPLLDHEVLELAARIPSRYKVGGGQTKRVLKQAYRDQLPDDILRRPKQGFEIPIDAWLRGPLRPMLEATVLDPQSRLRDLIDQSAARRVYQAHQSGLGRHGNVLWSLLMLGRWAERYLRCSTRADYAALHRPESTRSDGQSVQPVNGLAIRPTAAASTSSDDAPEPRSRRTVAVFAGGDASASTIEQVEAIARAFPAWRIVIWLEFPRRSRLDSIRSLLLAVGEKPLAYPLGLATSFLHRLLGARGSGGGPAGGAAPCLPRSLERLDLPNVEYRPCSSLHDAEVIQAVGESRPWLGIALGAPLLRPSLFRIPQVGTVSLHKSLLPRYRGTPPGWWQLYNGEKKTGASVYWVEEALYAGNIVSQREMPIPQYATAAGLLIQLEILGTEVLLDALGKIEGGCVAGTPQEEASGPPNRTPPWLLALRLRRRLEKQRRPPRSILGSLRHFAKHLALAAYVFAWAPLRNRLRALRGRCHTAILLYHRVGDEFYDSTTVGVEQFHRQMTLLKQHYEVLDLATFLATRGQPRKRPCVVITFDDGYANNYLAAVVLRRVGLPCTFFLSTGIVGTDRPFPHDLARLGYTVPSLTWAQVKEMADWGFTFGIHTVNHARLAALPRDEALAEVACAKEDLEQRLGATEATRSLAYPYGRRTDMSDDVRFALRSIGVEWCFSAYGGVNDPEWEPLDVLRCGVTWAASDLVFLATLEGWTRPPM